MVYIKQAWGFSLHSVKLWLKLQNQRNTFDLSNKSLPLTALMRRCQGSAGAFDSWCTWNERHKTFFSGPAESWNWCILLLRVSKFGPFFFRCIAIFLDTGRQFLSKIRSSKDSNMDVQNSSSLTLSKPWLSPTLQCFLLKYCWLPVSDEQKQSAQTL